MISKCWTSLLVFLFILVLWVIYHIWGTAIFLHACEGQFGSFLNQLFSARISEVTPEYCSDRAGQFVSYFLTAILFTSGFIAVYIHVIEYLNSVKRSWFGNCVIILLTIFLIFSGSELGVRLYQLLKDEVPFSKNLNDFYDPILGWRGEGRFGNLRTDRPKVFFIGDSFTEAKKVSESAKFFNVIRDELKIEPFVYGRTSYGTLQEYLILDRYMDLIEPDLIVLQICSNDFINNSYELEKLSFFNNKRIQRPYWINGQIELRFPRDHEWLHAVKFKLSSYSRLFHFILIGFDYLSIRLWQLSGAESVEMRIKREGVHFDLFRESVEITDHIVGLMQERVSGVPIVVIPTDRSEPYLGEFRKIFQKYKIRFLEEASIELEHKKASGVLVTFKDGVHWNDQGHRIAGQVISAALQNIVRRRS